MKEDKEKWISNVLDSAKGSQRAKPSPGLFTKIENRIAPSEAKVIPLFQLRMAAAAAVILCLMNVSILYQQTKKNTTTSQELRTYASPQQQLISNYNLYD